MAPTGTLQQDQCLASPGQDKGAIFPVHRVAGVDVVALVAFGAMRGPIERSDLDRIGLLVNDYLADPRTARAADNGCSCNDPLCHPAFPLDCQLSSLKQYVQEHNVTPDELRFMVEVAIVARHAIFGVRDDETMAGHSNTEA